MCISASVVSMVSYILQQVIKTYTRFGKSTGYFCLLPKACSRLVGFSLLLPVQTVRVWTRISKGTSWRFLLIGLDPYLCLTEVSRCLDPSFSVQQTGDLEGTCCSPVFLWGPCRRQKVIYLLSLLYNICLYLIKTRRTSHQLAEQVEGHSAICQYRIPMEHLNHYYLNTQDDHQCTYIGGKLVLQLNFNYSLGFYLIFICHALKQSILRKARCICILKLTSYAELSRSLKFCWFIEGEIHKSLYLCILNQQKHSQFSNPPHIKEILR